MLKGIAAGLVLALLAGCGSGHQAAAKRPRAARSQCVALVQARGYRACGKPLPWQIRRDNGEVVQGAIEVYKGSPVGYWRKVMLSADNKTLLGQWSGACEIQTTFFVPTGGGEPRTVTGQRLFGKGPDGWGAGPESEALGWNGRRARVLLPDRGERIAQEPGVYLVDPVTFRRTLVRKVAGRRGC